MNDRHPSGTPTPTGSAPDASYGQYPAYGQQDSPSGYSGYDGYPADAFGSVATGYGDGGPLFGTVPDGPGTGAQWDTGAQQTAGYDAYGSPIAQQQPYEQHGYGGQAGYEQQAYDTGGYDTSGMWAATGYQQAADIPAQPGPEDAEMPGQWDSGQYEQPRSDQASRDQHQFGQARFDEPAQAPYGHEGYAGDQFHSAAAFDATAFDPAAFDPAAFDPAAFDPAQYGTGQYETITHYGTSDQFGGSGEWDATLWQAPEAHEPHDPTPEAEPERTAAFEAVAEPAEELHEQAAQHDPYDQHGEHDEHGQQHGAHDRYDRHEQTEDGSDLGTVTVSPTAAAPRHPVGVSGSRSRRRSPAKRSALLTVAVPSVAVMGVAGIAAASVTTSGNDDSKTTQAAPDEAPVKASTANNKLDTQLAGLTDGADDFADRASRTQERIDLKKRQAEEKKRKEEEAARKEALRPKFALPVSQHGLSAYYGQGGVNWMSVHTGIDFPVSYGTSVMAATDGTVRTQYNTAYGNMAIVTAADGTETWYCHLSSTKIRTGYVKAGDTIAYSGNSGNSTGPHLHFEVHPGGGSAINPLSWLQSHGLDPQ